MNEKPCTDEHEWLFDTTANGSARAVQFCGRCGALRWADSGPVSSIDPRRVPAEAIYAEIVQRCAEHGEARPFAPCTP